MAPTCSQSESGGAAESLLSTGRWALVPRPGSLRPGVSQDACQDPLGAIWELSTRAQCRGKVTGMVVVGGCLKKSFQCP